MKRILTFLLLVVAVAADCNGFASNCGLECAFSSAGSNRGGAATVGHSAGWQQCKTTADVGGVEYCTADSIEVEMLLKRNDYRSPLDYARYFLGRPYVAYTLEGAYRERGDGVEKLVVNLREFDCLTLLETCNALALAKAELVASGEQSSPWAVYCRNLASLRYFGGQIDGYASRLHYLSMSIADHVKRGDMLEVPFADELTLSRKIDIHFMSKHPQYYSALKGNSALLQEISQLEAQYSGGTFRYLPQDKCGLSRQRLSSIHDGDIIYIVTDKDGLDYAHQGFAFWGQDGKLHMLHASSAKHKVIADPLTLEAYLRGIPSSIGIRVFRLSGAK